MVFGGLHKNSLIDYPGKLSCVLFFSGCNFRCPYCHNPDLALGCGTGNSPWEEDRVFGFLDDRKTFLDGVVISGGEPTLQKDLVSLCEKIKLMDYPVKLDTNGSRPEVIRELLNNGLVDYIAMDIKTDPACYSPLMKNSHESKNIITSIRTIMECSSAYEFRTTCVKPFVTPTVVENICHHISGADLFVLQQFNEAEVLEPGFFKSRECFYLEGELDNLKSIADPWVKECFIR